MELKISPSREADRKWRVELTEQMLDALHNTCPVTAKEIGKTTRWLSEQIRTKDYTEDDAKLLYLDSKWAKLEAKSKELAKKQ